MDGAFGSQQFPDLVHLPGSHKQSSMFGTQISTNLYNLVNILTKLLKVFPPLQAVH